MRLPLRPLAASLAGRAPFELTVFVTSACNLRCAHCFYWERLNQKGALTAEEFEALGRTLPRVARLTLSGGEPFLRADLARVVAALCARARPAYLTIPSSGWYGDRTVRAMEAILPAHRETFCNVSLSLDALGAARDRFMGRAGSFDRMVATARALQALQRAHPNLGVTCITTMTRANQDHLEAIFRFAVDELGVDHYTLSAPHGTTAPDVGELAIDPEKYRAAARRVLDWQLARARAQGSRVPLYELFLANREEVHRNTHRTLSEGRWFLPCRSGALRAVVLETGEVYACEVQMPRGEDFLIGRLRDHGLDFQRLWDDPRRRAVTDRIARERCVCTHGCDMAVNTLFSPATPPRIAGRVALTVLRGGR